MDSTKPRSFLNYLFFDENMRLIPEESHLWQADGEANWSEVGTDAQEDIEARQSGYVVVYLSNQSNSAVFFDNLVVTMQPGALLEERHYYPYGLPIQGIVPWAEPKGTDNATKATNTERKLA